MHARVGSAHNAIVPNFLVGIHSRTRHESRRSPRIRLEMDQLKSGGIFPWSRRQLLKSMLATATAIPFCGGLSSVLLAEDEPQFCGKPLPPPTSLTQDDNGFL